MLPAVSATKPARRNISHSSAVVVVLPLVPVMAAMGAAHSRYPNSISPHTGTLASRRIGAARGTPGLVTTRSQPASARCTSTPSLSAAPAAISFSSSPPFSRDWMGLLSYKTGVAPSSSSTRAQARPERAMPAIKTRISAKLSIAITSL